MKTIVQNNAITSKTLGRVLSLFSIISLSVFYPCNAQIISENVYIGTAIDAAAEDLMGGSVAISGNTAVVGAIGEPPENVGDNFLPGSAYVFVLSGGAWTQQAKLTASDAADGDRFGDSVGISGDTVVVGAYGDDDGGSYSGSAYVFTRSGGVWTQQAKLTASDADDNDYFGDSVAISGDTAVVGASGDYGGGSLYVFTRLDGVWTQQAKLTALDAAPQDEFGTSVAISGDTIVVGSLLDDAANRDSGSSYVFTRLDGVWTQQAKLTASDAARNDRFGNSVAIFEDTVVVGAYRDNAASSNSGSAYVFTRSDGVWTQQAKLTASDAAANDTFGNSVSVSGDTIVVGAVLDDDAGESSGSAYVFTRSDGVWTQQAKLTAPNAAVGDEFGTSVAVSGDTAVVGAIRSDIGSRDSGSAYIYRIITDNNPLVTVAFDSTMSSTENEANSAHQVPVRLTVLGHDVLDEAISVDVIDRGTGTATPGKDYVAVAPQTLVFPAGLRDGDTRSFEVGVIHDNIFERNETVEFELVNIQGSALFGVTRKHRVTITDDDPLISITFASGTSFIGEELELTHPVPVRLNIQGGGVLVEAVSVDVIDTGRGTATPGVDYVAFTPKTLTFPAGFRDGDTQSVELKTIDDANFEGEETVNLELVNVQEPALMGSILNHQVTVADNEQIVTLAFDSAIRFANDESNTSHSVSVKLAILGRGVLSDAVSVDVIDRRTGTATPGIDYVTFPPVTLVFPAGSKNGATQSFSIQILQDSETEGVESINLVLSDSIGEGMIGEQNTHKISIYDDGYVTSARMYWIESRGKFVANLDGSNGDGLGGAGTFDDFIIHPSDNTIYWYERYSSIRRVDGKNGNREVLLIERGNGLGLDVVNNKFYWTTADAIRRANLDASNIENFIVFDTRTPQKLAVDAGGGKLYWSTSNPDGIQRANLDGSAIEEVIADVAVARISLDVVGGKLYWITAAQDQKIQRANLDGTQIEDVISMTPINDLAIDVVSRKLYWTGATTIRRADLNGANSEYVFTERSSPTEIFITTPQIPWVQFLSPDSEVDESLDSHTVSIEITVPVNGMLLKPVAVDLIDTGTGSAVADIDYRSFERFTLVFPEGTKSRTIQTFKLDVIPDRVAEDDEVVNLRLGDVQGVVSLGPVFSHRVIVVDDDGLSPQAMNDIAETRTHHPVRLHIIENDADPDGSLQRFVADLDDMDDSVTWGNLGIDGAPVLSKFIRFRTLVANGVLFDVEFGRGADAGLVLIGGYLQARVAF